MFERSSKGWYVTVMVVKTVVSTLPTNSFGVPDIHVEWGYKDEDV